MFRYRLDLPQFAGRTIGEIAAEKNADPYEAALDYLVADRGQTRVLVSSISEDDIRTLIASPSVMVGSDGNAVAPYGTTGQGKPHPRFYGTFARILGRYVRELGLIPIETAIHKMTGASARALGISGRGLLREGFAADVTVFDPETVAETATYRDPHSYARRRRPGMGQRRARVRRGRAHRRHAGHGPRPRIGGSGVRSLTEAFPRVLYWLRFTRARTGPDRWPNTMSKS